MMASATFRGRPVQDKKEQKTAHQLASRIQERLGREVFIWVDKHPVHGWHATIYAPANEASSLQPIIDEIARELRAQYDLKE
jgi:hypothetical protein